MHPQLLLSCLLQVHPQPMGIEQTERCAPDCLSCATHVQRGSARTAAAAAQPHSQAQLTAAVRCTKHGEQRTEWLGRGGLLCTIRLLERMPEADQGDEGPGAERNFATQMIGTAPTQCTA